MGKVKKKNHKEREFCVLIEGEAYSNESLFPGDQNMVWLPDLTPSSPPPPKRGDHCSGICFTF